MAGEGDEDLIVTIEGDTEGGDGEQQVILVDQTGVTEGTTGRAPVRKQLPDDPVETLRAQLAERSAEVEKLAGQVNTAHSLVSQANQRIARAENEAAAARTEAAHSTRTTIDSGIAAAKAEADAAEADYKVAFEAGDGAAVAKAQRRISRAEADMAMLEQAKAELPDPKATQPRRTEQAPPVNDPVEQWIESRTEPTKKWLRAHMDVVRDPKKNAKMQAAHFDAESEGLALDTPEYFDHVEKFLGLKKAAPAQEQQQQRTNGADQQHSQRRPTAPAAPVTNTGGGLDGGKREVRLTRGEAAAATDGTLVWNYPDPTGKNRWKQGDPIGVQEMARRKEQGIREGRYQNANVDGT